MNLTTAQLQTLKTWVNTNHGGAFDQSAADALNVIASPDYWLWNRSASVEVIFGNVTHKNFTPIDVVPATDAGNQFLNRALICQIKQMNLDRFILGRTVLDASITKVWQGIRDALQDVPAGVAGALVDVGWAAVRDNALQRKARVGEKLFVSTGAGSHADASVTQSGSDGLPVEGLVTLQNVIDAANS